MGLPGVRKALRRDLGRLITGLRPMGWSSRRSSAGSCALATATPCNAAGVGQWLEAVGGKGAGAYLPYQDLNVRYGKDKVLLAELASSWAHGEDSEQSRGIRIRIGFSQRQNESKVRAAPRAAHPCLEQLKISGPRSSKEIFTRQFIVSRQELRPPSSSRCSVCGLSSPKCHAHSPDGFTSVLEARGQSDLPEEI